MGDVALARINPLAQLGALVLVTVTLLASVDVVVPSVVLVGELALLPAAGLARPRVLLRRTWPLLLGAATVGVVNTVVSSAAGPLQGLALALRVVGLALPGVLLVAGSEPVAMADALALHARVSTRFAVGALAALRLVPLLGQEWESITLARRTRGVDSGGNPWTAARLFGGAVFTLLVAAVRRGSRLATAMDARGFDSGVARTNARGSQLHARDAWFVGGTVALCATALAVAITAGVWAPLFVG